MRNYNWKMDDNLYLVTPCVEEMYRTYCELSFGLQVTRNFLGLNMFGCDK